MAVASVCPAVDSRQVVPGKARLPLSMMTTIG
jgi:hypothetical protein